MGRWVSIFAEEVYEILHARFKIDVKEKVHLRIVVGTDESIGNAGIFPLNTITLSLKQPSSDFIISDYRVWIEELVFHELIHIFTLDAHRGIYQVIRKIFGKVSPITTLGILLAPPNHTLPNWFLEGLAVFEETRSTPKGRLRSSEYEMIYRVAALYGQVPDISDLYEMSMKWPEERSVYVWGARFLLFMANKYGEEVLWNLVRKFSGRLPYLYNLGNTSILGKDDFLSNYNEMKIVLHNEQMEKINHLKKISSLTQFDMITTYKNNIVNDIEFSKQQDLFYIRRDIKDHIWLVRNKINDKEKKLKRITGLDVTHISYDNKNHIYYTELRAEGLAKKAVVKRININSLEDDLVLEGVSSRYVSVSSDQNKIVLVTQEEGISNIQLYDLKTYSKVNLTSNKNHFVNHHHPRFSNSGKKIVFNAMLKGSNHQQIYEITIKTQEIKQLIKVEGDCESPVYSSDDRVVIFSSDVMGINNLYGFDTKVNKLYQVTYFLEGAFLPKIDQTGQWIYFSHYGPYGYNIARIRYQPHKWFEPLSFKLTTAFDKTYPIFEKNNQSSNQSQSSKVDYIDISQIDEKVSALSQNNKLQIVKDYNPFIHMAPQGWLPFIPNELVLSGRDWLSFKYNKRRNYYRPYLGFLLVGGDPLDIHNYQMHFVPLKAKGLDESIYQRPIYGIEYRYEGLEPNFLFQINAQPYRYGGYFSGLDAFSTYPDYWVYRQNMSLTLTNNFINNDRIITPYFRIEWKKYLPDEYMETIPDFEDLNKWIFKGKVLSLGLGIIYDGAILPESSLSPTKGEGMVFSSFVFSNTIYRDGQDLDKKRAQIYKTIIDLKNYFFLLEPHTTISSHLKFGRLFGTASTTMERMVFNEYLYAGGYEGEFPIRGVYNLKGKNALIGSIELNYLLKPIYRNWDTWYWFNKNLTVHAIFDAGTVWEQKFDIDKIYSSIGSELRYNVYYFKRFPLSFGISYFLLLNTNTSTVYLYANTLLTDSSF